MVVSSGAGQTSRENRRFRLVVADDHPDMRQEIQELLDPEFEVLCAVGDGASLLRATIEFHPDAVISDIQMPEMDGIEASTQMLGRGLCGAIVVLSMYTDRYLVQSAMKAGILAYVLKLDASDELIPAIYAALRGERYLSAGVRDKSNFTPRNQ
jgi:DNA-binding NarL/FixJ family response regulator